MHPWLGPEMKLDAKKKQKKNTGGRKRSRERYEALSLALWLQILAIFFQRYVLETVDRAEPEMKARRGSAVLTDLWYSFRIQDLNAEDSRRRVKREKGGGWERVASCVSLVILSVDRIQPAHELISRDTLRRANPLYRVSPNYRAKFVPCRRRDCVFIPLNSRNLKSFEENDNREYPIPLISPIDRSRNEIIPSDTEFDASPRLNCRDLQVCKVK